MSANQVLVNTGSVSIKSTVMYANVKADGKEHTATVVMYSLIEQFVGFTLLVVYHVATKD